MKSPGWTIDISRQAQREIDGLPTEIKDRVKSSLAGLITHPRQGDIRKLAGRPNEFRLRIGDWRVIFRVEKARKQVVILAVRPRGSAYQD